MAKLKTHFEQVPLTSIENILTTERGKSTLISAGDRTGEFNRQLKPFIPRRNYEEVPSVPLFDVFKTEGNGDVIWRGASASMEEAKGLIQRLAIDAPGEYLILSHQTGNRLLIVIRPDDRLARPRRPN
jgi:hypothetical protein